MISVTSSNSVSKPNGQASSMRYSFTLLSCNLSIALFELGIQVVLRNMIGASSDCTLLPSRAKYGYFVYIGYADRGSVLGAVHELLTYKIPRTFFIVIKLSSLKPSTNCTQKQTSPRVGTSFKGTWIGFRYLFRSG